MTPLLLLVPGLIALAAGAAILRSFGPAYRVGRLLAATPVVPLVEALRIADDRSRYVAIRGRVDAEAPFEDDAHRPLVLRRTRLAIRDGGAWRTVDERLEQVAFQVRDGLDAVDVDVTGLDEGLVAMPRESVGAAADVPDGRLPDGTPPDREVRLRVEHVSAVDQAIVLGVPRRRADGTVEMGRGLGRPLIVSTLESDTAMRVLADGGGRRARAAAIALGTGLLLISAGIVWALLGALTGVADAASPSPSPMPGGDPRSSGQGPGLVGEPLMAIGLVLAIGLVAAVATYGWIRLTRPPSRG